MIHVTMIIMRRKLVLGPSSTAIQTSNLSGAKVVNIDILQVAGQLE
jgi:hypothetical protein